MNTREALLRAILTEPRDDTARLVMADYLDETGEPERAEFIRVQCALAPLLAEWGEPKSKLAFKMTERQRVLHQTFVPLQVRERELYAPSLGWAHPLLGELGWFSRGFVSRVECRCEDFVRHAEALFRAHPVTGVVLTDREPWVRGADALPDERFGWRLTDGEHIADPNFIPSELGDHLDGNGSMMTRFATVEDAWSGLSRACVRRGRRLAGLPPPTQDPP